MATASGDAKGTRRAVMPFVAYAVVLALLGGAGVALWTGQRSSLPGLTQGDRAPPPVPAAAPIEPSVEPARPAQGLKLPPRPAAAAASAPLAQMPAQAPASPAAPAPTPVPIASPPASPPTPSSSPSPAPTPSSPSEARAGDPAVAPAVKPAPSKTRCTADVGPWPTDRTDQGKAIQGLLRDLGLYDGTVYGTVGPTTRAAIRKFQLSVEQPETGEPDQALFESLKKKCAAPAP
jgi:hypothetical protein